MSCFSLLQQLWWGETRGTHAVSRRPFPPDYLRANNATAAAKRYLFWSCIMTRHERKWKVGGWSLSGFSTRISQLSVVIRAECWKETFHISYRCSYCCCLVVKVGDTRPWWWEGCGSSMCPSLLPGSCSRKGAGPPKNQSSIPQACINAGGSF